MSTDPLDKAMATHSSVLAWRIPGTGEPGGLLSMGPHRVGHDWSDLAAAAAMDPQCKPCSQTHLTVRPRCCSVRTNSPHSQARGETHTGRAWPLSKTHMVITFWDHTTLVWCSSRPAGPSGLSILGAHNPCWILDRWSNNGPQSWHNSALLHGGPDRLCQQSLVRLVEHRRTLEIPF